MFEVERRHSGRLAGVDEAAQRLNSVCSELIKQHERFQRMTERFWQIPANTARRTRPFDVQPKKNLTFKSNKFYIFFCSKSS